MPTDLLLRMAFNSGYEAGQKMPAAANCWSKPWICGISWMEKRY